jgi:hypothetical protein
MTGLRESIVVDRPAGQIVDSLERFFASLRGKDGSARIRLRVSADGPTRELSIDREVCVEARRPRGEASLDDLMLITWMPEGTAVFPTFEGILTVRESGEVGTGSIELAGTYTPPFGPAGQAFDAAIGHRIAERTAREFLKDLKSTIERPPRVT